VKSYDYCASQVLSQKTESPFVICNWKSYSSMTTKRISLLMKLAPLA